MADLFKTVPGPREDAVYNATKTFAQLVRDKSPDEIQTALQVAKTTLNGISGVREKRRSRNR